MELMIIVVIYFIPAFVAALRRHNDENAIAVLNIFLGWTVIGWVAALVWASNGNVKEKKASVDTNDVAKRLKAAEERLAAMKLKETEAEIARLEAATSPSTQPPDSQN
jgi:hypothetical protein